MGVTRKRWAGWCWLVVLVAAAGADELSWPAPTLTARPWAYNWWPGSAVDAANLRRELQRYADAGLGGIHIIPIYGVRGAEARDVPFLSPPWLDNLATAVREAASLDLGVDLTMGTGWCFGGPRVTPDEGTLAASLVDGKLVVRPTRQAVKRAAPGGAGLMLNPFYRSAMEHYVQRFEQAFATYQGARPRALYHDSYEYQGNWSPDLLAEFAKRRGYRLEDHLAELFGKAEGERAGRVRCDYRETVSDLMIESSMATWTAWCRGHGFQTRYQAHGSPANLLDLYALADMPETEMFHGDRSRLIAKLASSAGHTQGRPLISSETGTWLAEHFQETLGELKQLADDLFLSGVNHVFYHGCCYSPDDAAWPGWLFYAATEMNPRNAFWHDVPALNAYITRCQSVLQSGAPDHPILLYWPIHDLWSSSRGGLQGLTVHNRGWLDGQPLGATARWLSEHGYAFDYVSDRQLATAKVVEGRLVLPGASYATLVLPPCQHLPPATARRLLELARAGAVIGFCDSPPSDAPGLAGETTAAQVRECFDALPLLGEFPLGAGRLVVGGGAEYVLKAAGVSREPFADGTGLLYERRRRASGWDYFVANRGERLHDGPIAFARPPASVLVMDALTGATGRLGERLRLEPGQSAILRTFTREVIGAAPWVVHAPGAEAVTLTGRWQVEFVDGGPALPPAFATEQLGSWTGQGGEAERFAGTARYRLSFDSPGREGGLLDLGDVRHSARVRVNGRSCGTLLMPPYRVWVEGLRPTGNLLEVEVTNLSANRLRDLDRRRVPWRIFRDINFVNLDYKPFDASGWPLAPSGLLGPVRLR